jgi:hypothetical protein
MPQNRRRWLNPQLSVGRKSQDRIGGKNCYEVEGKAFEVYQIVAPVIAKLLNDSKDELERKGSKQCSIAFWMFMIGNSPETAEPFIIFASSNKYQRTLAKKLVEEAEVLLKHPEIRLQTISKMPAKPNASSTTSVEDVLTPEFNIIGEPTYLCGAALQCGNSRATLGGIIWVGDQYYGITAYHAGLELPIEKEKDVNSEDLDFDDSDDEEDLITTSQGKPEKR